MESGSPTRLKSPDWSIPSSSTAQESELHNPVPVISDHLPQQGFNPAHSSPGDESDKSSHETDIAKPMNLGKSGEEQENLRQEEREALEGRAKELQESLGSLFNRIEAVKEEYNKLDNHNKFLQKYIGDLMATSKITTSSSRAKK